ncbi:MAG: haloacid dehalogenase-like hydrolase [Deltaproteobacteria bacterium]|nr:haloacid dehalogenase-like hydrolase [Deltaproteobacteria bacterium]
MTQLLDSVLSPTLAALEKGERPVVVFDLDATLFDNGPRTWQILLELSEHQDLPELRKAVDKMPRTCLPYLLKDTLSNIGFGDEDFGKIAFKFWFERFFTDDYQRYDEPLPGAVHFAKELYEKGAHLVYLTGRDSPGMLAGCASSLRQQGFPVGQVRTNMILKPDFETADLDFKADAVHFISGLGKMVAAFDNEPGNCNLFKKSWPSAVVGFIQTQSAPGAPKLDENIVLFNDFND